MRLAEAAQRGGLDACIEEGCAYGDVAPAVPHVHGRRALGDEVHADLAGVGLEAPRLDIAARRCPACRVDDFLDRIRALGESLWRRQRETVFQIDFVFFSGVHRHGANARENFFDVEADTAGWDFSRQAEAPDRSGCSGCTERYLATELRPSGERLPDLEQRCRAAGCDIRRPEHAQDVGCLFLNGQGGEIRGVQSRE